MFLLLKLFKIKIFFQITKLATLATEELTQIAKIFLNIFITPYFLHKDKKCKVERWEKKIKKDILPSFNKFKVLIFKKLIFLDS